MKNIAIYSRDDESWIGGLYYKRSVLYMLNSNPSIRDKVKLSLFCFPENEQFYKKADKDIDIIPIRRNKYSAANVVENIFKCKKHHIKFLFSYNRDLFKFGVHSLAWIPDFQDKHFPQYFSTQEIEKRDKVCRRLVDSNVPVVLSSNTCKDDFVKYYGGTNTIVMPFVSYILPEIGNLPSDNDILKKYNLINKKYILISNQFWKHKNHIIALKAFDDFVKRTNSSDTVLVLTGKVDDYRNPEYISDIKKIINEHASRHTIYSLGFIPREDQLVLIKNAEFLIQPSLSEGWGTFVEDAKVFDKTVLLSDIPVHHEQKSDKCILFDPHNEKQLSEMISNELKKQHFDDVATGIRNMKARAIDYTREFANFIMENS